MKKIILWLFLGLTYASFAQNGSIWKSQVKPIFQGLDKSRVPNGILLDYAMEFTDVGIYNGYGGSGLSSTPNSMVDINVFSNIYKTLFMGRTTTDTLTSPRFKALANKWASQRRNKNQLGQKTIVLAGLYYKYAKIRYKALVHNKIG